MTRIESTNYTNCTNYPERREEADWRAGRTANGDVPWVRQTGKPVAAHADRLAGSFRAICVIRVIRGLLSPENGKDSDICRNRSFGRGWPSSLRIIIG